MTGTITAVTPPWGTDRLIEGQKILARHLTDLRTAINVLRQYYGLAQVTFTDPIITAGETKILMVHITELQQALVDVLKVNTFIETPVWENVEADKRIMASHFNQLREVIEKL